MRAIVLDTETTGLDPKSGHRIVEIGCVELHHGLPTGQVYHVYLNPQRSMPAEAFRVHGLSEEFLSDKPLFHEIIDDFLDFIKQDPLIIHNARFDMKFLNAELENCGKPLLPFEQAIDTLAIAKQKFPGSPVNLDALCRRFQIDNSSRIKHGALLDAEILAEVYLELLGGRQTTFDLGEAKKDAQRTEESSGVTTRAHIRPERFFPATQEELSAHAQFLTKIKNPIWEQTG